jgi:hypothetical protein
MMSLEEKALVRDVVVSPTKTVYNELQRAYDTFNLRLFDNSLPRCSDKRTLWAICHITDSLRPAIKTASPVNLH